MRVSLFLRISFFIFLSGLACAEEPWEVTDISCDDCLQKCIRQHPFRAEVLFLSGNGIDDERRWYHENYACTVKCMTTKCPDFVNSNHEIIEPQLEEAIYVCIHSQTAADDKKSFPNFSKCDLSDVTATHICREECYFSTRWKLNPACRNIQNCSDCIACCDTPQTPGVPNIACQEACRQSVCNPEGDIKGVVNRSCSGGDLNLKVGSSRAEAPFSEIPVYNQMSTPSCYSFAAASLIDSYRMTHLNADSSHLTDPFLFHYLNNHGRSQESGGTINQVVKYAQTNGVCNHRAIFQPTSGGPKTASIDATGAVAICNDVVKHFYEDPRISRSRVEFQTLTSSNSVDIESWFQLHPEITEAYDDMITNMIGKTNACSGESIAISKKDVQIILNSIFMQVLSQLGAFGPSYLSVCSQVFQELCKERSISVPLPDLNMEIFKSVTKSASQHQKIRDTIGKNLTAKLPVGVEFCANFTLTQPPFSNSFFQTLPENLFPKEDDCGDHGVLIIGQKTVKASDGNTYCKYLIRNSWGKDCGVYHEKRQQDCEDGDLWIDSQDLLNSSPSIVSFKDEKKK